MKKILSRDDLTALYDGLKDSLTLRCSAPHNIHAEEKELLCCGGTGCHSSRSAELMDNLRALLKKNKLDTRIKVVQVGCFGFCAAGPIVKIMPDNVFYTQVMPEDAEEIVRTHIIGKQLVERLLYVEPTLQERIHDYARMSFYARQKRIALRNCGLIAPEKIEEYIASEGYLALAKCLFELTAQEVIKTISDSGLRGRGGAGFPTGRKWQIASEVDTPEKYVVCNADEGDPGAFMDRSIMEGDPHCVVEAMTIAAYAIGAAFGLVYIRAEYPLAVNRLELAIGEAREAGLLGRNILGSGFDFDIEIKLGAGAFVCGEETALIHSMEGLRGEPTSKPPYPAASGYWGMSTTVNNVETLANVPQIVRKGAAWYSAIGTEDSRGTKVFALAGQVNNVGLVEVPMGTTLGEIIYGIGGGISGGHEFKALQTGGPSGGCITKENLDLPIDYANLTRVGSMMGSGGMIVLSEKDCMVAMAKFYLGFTVDESCGKCAPCRIGTRRMLEMLEKICNGNGTMKMLDDLELLARTIKDTALCGLGQTAPNPILSTLHFFRDEYIAHVRDKHCPSGVCKKLFRLVITDKCIGCTKCARLCPVNAISGELKHRHSIDLSKCIKCEGCLEGCPVQAIVKE